MASAGGRRYHSSLAPLEPTLGNCISHTRFHLAFRMRRGSSSEAGDCAVGGAGRGGNPPAEETSSSAEAADDDDDAEEEKGKERWQRKRKKKEKKKEKKKAGNLEEGSDSRRRGIDRRGICRPPGRLEQGERIGGKRSSEDNLNTIIASSPKYGGGRRKPKATVEGDASADITRPD